MRKALVVEGIVTLATASLHGVSLAQTGSRKIRLVIREVSLGKIHPGIVERTLVVSPDSQRVAYVAVRSGRWLVVVDELEGKEYDGFLGSRLVFDSPKLLHTLVVWHNKFFRVEVEIVEE